jgi:hypothetical protein
VRTGRLLPIHCPGFFKKKQQKKLSFRHKHNLTLTQSTYFTDLITGAEKNSQRKFSTIHIYTIYTIMGVSSILPLLELTIDKQSCNRLTDPTQPRPNQTKPNQNKNKVTFSGCDGIPFKISRPMENDKTCKEVVS